MLEIHLLGQVRLSRDGAPVTITTRKETALLVYLACTRQSHSRETLAELLWQDREPQRALSNLRTVLWHLQRDVGLSFALEGDRVALAPEAELWVDALDFRSRLEALLAGLPAQQPASLSTEQAVLLEATLQRYHGNCMEEFFVRGARGFEEWLAVQQETLHHQVVKGWRILVADALARGAFDRGLSAVARWLALEPYDEAAHRQRITLLAQNGQRGAALDHYRICRALLHDELQVEPEPATTALYMQIQEGALGWEAGGAAEPPNPYQGLQAFSTATAEHFFGREAFVAWLLARLADAEAPAPEADEPWLARFLAVVGPSGSGKSSVVQAGLLPALQEGRPWFFAVMQPGTDPAAALATILAQALPGAGLETMPPLLPPGSPDSDEGLAPWLAACLPPNGRFFLILDQAEELMTLAPAQPRHQFMALLLAALRAPQSPLRLVAVLRADYYMGPLLYPGWGQLFTQRVEFTLPLTPGELRQAIVAPATRVGLHVEPALTATLITDAGQAPGALPLLQYTLTELFERRTGRALTLAAYQNLGGLAGALAGRAEHIYTTLTPEEQAIARQIFLRLATLQERGDAGLTLARRRAPLAEMRSLFSPAEGAGEAPPEAAASPIQPVLDTFSHYRMLTLDRDPQGNATVQVAHEALFTAWPRLREWLRMARADLLRKQQLEAHVATWEQHGRQADLLLRGNYLAQFEEWLAASDLRLTRREEAYLAASRTVRAAEEARVAARRAREAYLERRGQLWQRWLIRVLAVAVCLTLSLALYALYQRRLAQREADVAQSLNLATSAQLALDEDNTDLALLLAMEANRLDNPPPQAQLMLAEAAYAPGARRRFAGHTAPVEGLVILPGGNRAISASADRTLILWDLGGAARRRFEGHTDAVHDVALLPGGDRALSASADGTLILWNVETGERVRTFTGHESAVWSVAVSPDGRTALSGAGDGTLILWNLETGEVLRHLEGHAGAVYSVAISSDGRQALSGSADRSVILWNLENGTVLRQMSGVADTVAGSLEAIGHYDSVWGVAFRPDGRTAVSVSQDEFAILWDLETGQLVSRVDTNVGLLSVAMSSDGRTALLGTLDNRVLLLDLESGQISLQLRGHTARVQAVAFTPDGRGALSGEGSGELRLWNLYNGAEMRRITYIDPLDPAAAAVAVSSDGRMGMTALWTGEISLWDYASGEEIHRLRGHTQMAFGGVLFVPGGRRAVSGAGDIFAASVDNTVRVWDVETGQELLRLEGHTDKIWDIDVSADGRFVASASHDGTLRLWDIFTEPAPRPPPSESRGEAEGLNASLESGEGRVLLDVSPQAVRSVAFSPDGRFVVLGLAKGQSSNPDYSLRLLEVETGREVRRLAGHQDVVGDVAFSPDGRLILSGSNGIAILWDAASGEQVHRFIGHAASVVAIAFSPDGRLAVSGAVDGSLFLWDAERGIALRRYVGLSNPVVSVAFVPDGRSFFAAADDDAVHEYRIDAAQDDLLTWITANRYAPEMTCEQRVQYHVEPLCE